MVTPLTATPVAGSRSSFSILSRDPGSAGPVLVLNLTNGVQAHLQVPGGAFLDEVGLNTTEITAIGSMVSSVVAAIRVDPGELVAELPLTATFMIPGATMAGLDLSQLVGFVADADGSNLHLVPLVAGRFGGAAERPAVKLDHLGIAGIALATPAQQAVLQAAWPADPADQLPTALAPQVTAQWRAAVRPQSSGNVSAQGLVHRQTATTESVFLPILRGYFNDVVVPAFAAAYGDPTQIPAAIQTGFQFLRSAELTGLSGPGGPLQGVAADLDGRISTLIDTYADYIAGQCRSIGGPPQLQAMLGQIRTLELLGHGAKASELSDVLPQCSRFKATYSHDYLRVEHWVANASQPVDLSKRMVIEGDTVFGLNTVSQLSPLRLTTLEFSSVWSGGSRGITLEKDGSTSNWGMYNLSIPVVRTRGGTPSTSVELSLLAYGPKPFSATEVSTFPDGRIQSTPGVTVAANLSVPALPLISGNNYGPILIPQSGSVTSQSSFDVPNPGPGGTVHETHKVTITITRAE